MTHSPAPQTPEHPDRHRVDAAIRALVHLLARQAVREAMEETSVQDGGTDGRQEQV